jgi:hypothetical protein
VPDMFQGTGPEGTDPGRHKIKLVEGFRL